MYRGGYAPITCLQAADWIDYIITKVKQSRLLEVKIHCDMRYTIEFDG